MSGALNGQLPGLIVLSGMLLSEKNQESGEMAVTLAYTGEIQFSLNI